MKNDNRKQAVGDAKRNETSDVSKKSTTPRRSEGGSGVGAVGGAAAGALLGAVAGPVGAAVGLVAGAVAGVLASSRNDRQSSSGSQSSKTPTPKKASTKGASVPTGERQKSEDAPAKNNGIHAKSAAGPSSASAKSHGKAAKGSALPTPSKRQTRPSVKSHGRAH